MSSPSSKAAIEQGVAAPVDAQAADDLTIPVLEEVLQVGVRRVDTERGVRVHTTVTERQEPLDVLLRSEQVDVVRVPVDRIVAADEAPVSRQEGATLIVPILEEVLVVEKRVRIKEEVRITRTEREHHHVASVALRSEQVSIERIGEGGDAARTPDASLE